MHLGKFGVEWALVGVSREMKPMLGKRWFGLAVLACGLLLSAGVTHAQDRGVMARLKRYGDLRAGQARRVMKRVSQRMAKSADNLTPHTDPLRVAVSQVLFRADRPPNKMQGAKVRLRLFAGFNTWALEALFKPAPGQIGACRRNFKLGGDECAALVAAGGRVSVAEAERLAAGGGAPGAGGFGGREGGASPFGGTRVAPVVKRAGARPRPVAARPMAARSAPSAPRGGRFKKFDSGFRGSARPAARPMASRQPAAPAGPQVSSSQQKKTKEAYKARREAYLARQKARMEARKRGTALAAGPPAGAAKSAKGSGKKEEADKKAAVEEEPVVTDDVLGVAPPPKKQAGDKQALSDDFLNSLLD